MIGMDWYFSNKNTDSKSDIMESNDDRILSIIEQIPEKYKKMYFNKTYIYYEYEFGSRRDVIILDNVVFKIPKEDNKEEGRKSNITEMKFYKKYGKKKDLGKCYYCSENGDILIMKRYNEVFSDNSTKLAKYILKHYKNDPFMLSDFNISNWGCDENGKIVKIDYGEEDYMKYYDLNSIKWYANNNE